MNGQKDIQTLREIGAKLANFRNKLAIAIGQKKITQIAFGEMFGGQSKRQITSYERGEVDAPASLFYCLWLCGHSIDGIFAEHPVTEIGAAKSKQLFESLSFVETEAMDEESLDRAIKEAENVKAVQNQPTKETSGKHPGKGKERHSKTRATKKR